MLGREVGLPSRPQRIVSLCPSITETLFALGLDARIVGVTRYCIHPSMQVTDKAKVGGTKQLQLAAIAKLKPDLIIAEKEENRREDVEALAKDWPVYVVEVRDLSAAQTMIERLGEVCDCQATAAQLANDIDGAWQALPRLKEAQRAAYLIWRKPWMAAGSQTYIDAVMQRLGLENVFAGQDRYPEFDLDALVARSPALILLSSEPFPFAEKHVRELEMRLPHAHIQLVDGEAFSWYGARMLPSASYLARLLYLWELA